MGIRCLVVAVLLGHVALASPAVAAVSQTRIDPEDSPGPGAADVRWVRWTLDDGTATLEVALRRVSHPHQVVSVWMDQSGDGASERLVRFWRGEDTEIFSFAVLGTSASRPGCQTRYGDTDGGAPTERGVQYEDSTMKFTATFPYTPVGGTFRWGIYAYEDWESSEAFDAVPDGIVPPDARQCDGGSGFAMDLARGVRFPDGPPPVAAFDTDRAEPVAGRPFTAVSRSTDDGAIVDWRWEIGPGDAFDDGSGPELPLLMPAGEHVIGLRVTDDTGLSSTVRRTITVVSDGAFLPLAFLDLLSERPLLIPGPASAPEGKALEDGNRPPTIRLRAQPRRVRSGRLVRLDASRSRDDGGRAVAFEWDLDGDSEFDDGRSPRVTTAFSRVGRQRVSVRATDAKGLTGVASTFVKVRPGAPVRYRNALSRALRGDRGSVKAAGLERGLRGWRRVGDAFPRKPTAARRIPLARELETSSRLGGSYAAARVPVGAAGRRWISSFAPGRRVSGLSPDARAEIATGAIVSPALPVRKRYLNLLVGGDDEREGKRSLARVEIWAPGRRPRLVRSVAAGENEPMRTVFVDLESLVGDRVVIAAVDQTTKGHLNFDSRGFSPRRPARPPAPVWGFADPHTHPMAHQSFGGLKGHRTYMGVPGGDVRDYEGVSGAGRYLSDTRDFKDHKAGTALVRTGFEVLHDVAPDAMWPLHEQMHITEIRRAWQGGLRLISSLAVSNETLETATGAIVDGATGGEPCGTASGLCEDYSFDPPRVRATVRTTRDRDIIEAMVAGMRQLADMNSGWMEIVYSPADAHRAISQGKLAVVLGSEVDGLGRLGFPSPEAEVEWLWRLGIRQLNPIHAIDNPLGGAPLFEDLYNTTNDLVNRPERDVRRNRIADEVRDDGLRLANPAARFGVFMDPENWDCGGTVLARGECVDWHFDSEQKIVGLDHNFKFGAHPWFHQARAYPDDRRGQRNRRGLTDDGRRYVREMMRRGMLIDIEHMSERTIDGLVSPGLLRGELRGPIWDGAPAQLACEPGDSRRPRSMRPGCFDRAYPIMSSHTNFRAQSLTPASSHVKGNWAREFERTPRQVELIRESGGIIAPMVAQDPIIRPPTIPRARVGFPVGDVVADTDARLRTDVSRADLNDCAGSSKGWITAYLYGVQKMRGRGVALSTDMAVVGATGPRFNPSWAKPDRPKSCNTGYRHFKPQINVFDAPFIDRKLEEEIVRNRKDEEALAPGLYNRGQPESTRVRYFGPEDSVRPPGGLLTHRRPDGARYDFNTGGMLAYGALPDLLQDARNVGVASEDLVPLMSSAQAYIDMWTKAYRVTGCYRGNAPTHLQRALERCRGGNPAPIEFERVCANTCPRDPGRGHELLPNGEPLVGRGGYSGGG